MDVVKGVEIGIGVPDICPELGVSTRLFTNGGLSMAAWMSP
jgi:hypothetical protein